MSQTTENTVSPAFRKTPINPNLSASARMASADEQQISSSVAPPPSPSGEVSSPTEQSQAGSPSPPSVISSQPLSPQPPQQYQLDWGAVVAQQQRQAQLERENAEMHKRLQEQYATIDNLVQIQKEYDKLQQQQQLAADANSIDYSQLVTVDSEDAKRISEGVLRVLDARLAPMRQELAQQRQQLAHTAQHQEQRFVQQRAQDTLSKIVGKHPDFLSLQNNTNFKVFMQQRDGYSYQTLDDRAAAEFKMGNADYINHLIDQFKQTQPSSASITSVAPVQTATAPMTPPAPAEQLPTLSELNSMMQMRQITPDQYRDWLGKIRAAQNI